MAILDNAILDNDRHWHRAWDDDSRGWTRGDGGYDPRGYDRHEREPARRGYGRDHRERYDHDAGNDHYSGGDYRGSDYRASDHRGSDHRGGPGPYYGAGSGRGSLGRGQGWRSGVRDHDERRASTAGDWHGGDWHGGGDEDDRERFAYGGGRYGMSHHDSRSDGNRRHDTAYGDEDEDAYGRSSISRGRDFGDRFGGSQHDGAVRRAGEAMGMGAGLARGGSMAGRGPKGYTRSDDRIREDVCDCLTDDPYLDASSVEVQVRNGEVTLGGTVDSREAKRHAEDLAECVSGVKNVQNILRVQAGREAGAGTAGRKNERSGATTSIGTSG